MAFKTLIIGTGFGTRVVQGCYEEAGMEVVAVSPRDPEAVRQACAEPFDLISVHSPPFLHSQHVNWALDNGHNVLCDKPFGRSTSEAQQMLDRARELGVIHLLNFEFRLDPGRARVKEIIDSGAIGEVIHINWAFFNAFARSPQRNHGWAFEKDMGGGWIRINGCHQYDALRWLVGEVVEVDARARIDVKQRPDRDGAMQATTAEDGFTAFLTLDNGATVVIDTSCATPATTPDSWTIIGTKGMIEIREYILLFVDSMVRDTEIKLLIEGEDAKLERLGPFEGDAHLPSMRPWAKLVREVVSEHRQIEPSFAAGVASTDVAERIHAAIDAHAGG